MIRLSYIIFLFAVFSHSLSVAEGSETGKLLIRFYSDEVYKAHPENWSIAKGLNGIVYFGNRSVMLAYDGVEWKKIRVKLNAPVYSLQTGAEGRIYLGTEDDFGYLEEAID